MTPLEIIDSQLAEINSLIEEHRELVELYKAQRTVLNNVKDKIMAKIEEKKETPEESTWYNLGRHIPD